MIRLATKPAAALLGFALLSGTHAAQASMAEYVFSGTVDFGSLVGETYAGQFSFDDAGLTTTGPQSFDLSSLSFNFHGSNFGLADADTNPTADFQDGIFLGVSYSVSSFDPTFSLTSGFVDTTDASFAYTPSSGLGAGGGSVNFTPVPLPASFVFLLSGLAGLFRIGLKKTQA